MYMLIILLILWFYLLIYLFIYLYWEFKNYTNKCLIYYYII